MSDVLPACWSWSAPAPVDGDPIAAAVVAGLLTRSELRKLGRAYDLGANRMVDFHADRCAICGRPMRRIMVDHDHRTGLVRGYLCGGCNANEGRYDRAPYLEYRQRTPAAILGYVERFASTGPSQFVITVRRWGLEDRSRAALLAAAEVVRLSRQATETGTVASIIHGLEKVMRSEPMQVDRVLSLLAMLSRRVPAVSNRDLRYFAIDLVRFGTSVA